MAELKDNEVYLGEYPDHRTAERERDRLLKVAANFHWRIGIRPEKVRHGYIYTLYAIAVPAQATGQHDSITLD